MKPTAPEKEPFKAMLRAIYSNLPDSGLYAEERSVS